VKKLVPYALFTDSPQPWERLFIRCESKSDAFYVVEIYSTELQMQKAIKRQDVNSNGRGLIDRKCKACCFSYKAFDGQHRTTNEHGTIFFYKGNVGAPVLAHEFTHAALAWARRRRLDVSRRTGRYASDPEERVCHMVGYMMYQFYAKQKKRVFFHRGTDVRIEDIKTDHIIPGVPDALVIQHAI
jgi:hypothetical protein